MNPGTLRAALLAPVAAISLTACGVNSIPTAEEDAKARWADVPEPVSAPRGPHPEPGRQRPGALRRRSATCFAK
jgi:hypothetical protein